MRSFFRKYFIEPPIAFPLLALFHLLMAVYYALDFIGDDLTAGIWLKPLWNLAGCALLIGVCRFSRIAGVGYIGLTIAGLALRYFLQEETDLWYAATSLFPVDVIASSLILFFYKRLV